jgi:hypothetical protein
MPQRGSKDVLFGRLLAERRLCARRASPTVDLYFARIAIPSEA